MTPQLENCLVTQYINQLLHFTRYRCPRPEQAQRDLEHRDWRTLGDIATALYEGTFLRSPGPGIHAWSQSLSSFNNLLSAWLQEAVNQEFRGLTQTLVWCRRRNLSKFDETISTIKYDDPHPAGSSEPNQAVLQLNDETRSIESTAGWSYVLPRQVIYSATDPASLVELPRSMARRAARAVDTLVWGALDTNATLDDGTELFHADRGNLLTGAGSALSASSLAQATAALSDAVEALGITAENDVLRKHTARFLIVPSALQVAGLSVLSSLNLIGSVPSSTEYQQQPHGLVVPGIISLVVEPSLDAYSTKAWYLASAPQDQGFELLTLQQDELLPRIEPLPKTEILGCKFQMYLDAGVYVRHATAIVKSAGE